MRGTSTMHKRQSSTSSMKQAQGPEDDWTGLSSAQRRHIQNRLNQRAYRQRKAQEKVRSASGITTDELFNRELRAIISEEAAAASSSNENQASSSLQRYHNVANQISGDHVHLPMIKERLYAGLFSNATILGISIASLADPALGSPFVSPEAHAAFSVSDWYHSPTPATHIPASSTNLNLVWSIPQSLQPSTVQQLIPHHAYIDLYPCGKMRDNLIVATELEEDFDEAALCVDAMCGRTDTGLMVWGDPSLTESYELGTDFVRKWWAILKNCDDLLAATNRWREMRGDRLFLIGDTEEAVLEGDTAGGPAAITSIEQELEGVEGDTAMVETPK